MEGYLKEVRPPHRILMGPGPSEVHPRVLQAMTAPLLGHMDPEFFSVMQGVVDMLRLVFQTSNELTLPLSGTGTAGMEAALCNMLEPQDTVVIAVNGFFGTRMIDIATRCGAQVHTVSYPWGRPVEPEPLEKELRKHSKVKAVGVVHGETSTGILSPLPELANVTHNYGALFIADAVTPLGGHEVALDQWDVDVCYSATQKCLGAPPGMSPISLGPRATEVLRSRKSLVQSLYLNLVDLETYWHRSHVYHHTTPISMVYALREALRRLVEEGLENRFQRHARNAAALRGGLEALGLKLFADPKYQLNPLTTVLVPEGVDDARVRSRLLLEFNIEIGGGLGELQGRAWRIGLMGDSCTETNVFALLSALERILPREGYEVGRGVSMAAAQQVLADYDSEGSSAR